VWTYDTWEVTRLAAFDIYRALGGLITKALLQLECDIRYKKPELRQFGNAMASYIHQITLRKKSGELGLHALIGPLLYAYLPAADDLD